MLHAISAKNTPSPITIIMNPVGTRSSRRGRSTVPVKFSSSAASTSQPPQTTIQRPTAKGPTASDKTSDTATSATPNTTPGPSPIYSKRLTAKGNASKTSDTSKNDPCTTSGANRTDPATPTRPQTARNEDGSSEEDAPLAAR